jgi:hypothetical protein
VGVAVLAGCSAIIGIHPIDAQSDGAVSSDGGEGGACISSLEAGTNPSPLCSNSWCWVNPAPVGFDLVSAWGQCGEAWAVGGGGTAVHWDGATWTPTDLGTQQDLASVTGTSADDVWFMTTSGDMLHRVAGNITSYPLGLEETGGALWATSSSDVWAATNGGKVLRWAGSAWSLDPQAPRHRWVHGWASDPDNAWIVGDIGSIAHWDGTQWSSGKIDTDDCQAIWGSGPNDIYITTSNRIFHHGGGAIDPTKLANAWVDITSLLGTRESVGAVWGSSADDVWLMSATNLHHLDATGWHIIPSDVLTNVPLLVSLTGGISLARSEVVMTGPGCELVHGVDSRFVAIDSRPRSDITAIAGTSERDLWGSTRDSVLFRYDGALTPFDPRDTVDLKDIPGSLNAIWVKLGASVVEAWTAGENKVLRLDVANRAWQALPIPSTTDTTIRALWGTADAKSVWAVGGGSQGPEIYRLTNGSTWEVQIPVNGWPGDTTDTLRAITSVDGSEIWAVGTHGLAVKWDGTQWAVVPLGRTDLTLTSVSAYLTGDVWAAGPDPLPLGNTSDLLFHWNGTTWVAKPPPPARPTFFGQDTQIFAEAPDEVWMVGTDGELFHLLGTTWTSAGRALQLTSGMTRTYGATVGGRIWVVGSAGEIRTYSF